jgi:glutamine amidotransferase
MHNGQIGDWSLIRRRAEALIPDSLYTGRIGTTDSEAAFLAILGAGGERDPVAATVNTLGVLTDMVRASGTKEPLRFTSAMADGRDLYAFRYCTDDTANTLYYRESGGNVVVVSEPLDTDRAHWKLVPPGHLIVAREGQPVVLEPMVFEKRVAAE